MSSDLVEIVPYRDGPYLVRGPVVLRDQDGVAIDPRRPTVALCRCGKSKMRPFCDGTHQLIRFRAASAPESGRTAAERPARTPAAAPAAPAAPTPAAPVARAVRTPLRTAAARLLAAAAARLDPAVLR